MALKPEDRPTIDNYPALATWLAEVNARAAWSVNVNRDTVVSCFVIGTATAIAVVRSRQHGWDLYTPQASNDVAATLTDAAIRCGLLAAAPAPDIAAMEAEIAELRARLAENVSVITVKESGDPEMVEKVRRMLASPQPTLVIHDAADTFDLTRDERIELAAAARDGTASPCARAALRRILGEADPKAGPVDLGITSKSGR